jgi:ferritin-like metal-binding protein YciE
MTLTCRFALYLDWGAGCRTNLQEREHAEGLDGLFRETLKYVYYAEKEIHSALPTLAKAARSDGLRDALEKHNRVTQEHISRLEDVFEIIDKPARTEARLCRIRGGAIWLAAR